MIFEQFISTYLISEFLQYFCQASRYELTGKDLATIVIECPTEGDKIPGMPQIALKLKPGNNSV